MMDMMTVEIIVMKITVMVCVYTLIHNHQSITIKWYTELDTTLCNVYSIYCSSLNLQLSIIGR